MDTNYSDPSRLSTPGTIGELVHLLKKFDPEIPVKVVADHSISECKVKGKSLNLHRIHVDLSFDYTD